MELEFRHLTEAPAEAMIALMNDARVRRHLLFETAEFTPGDYAAFIAAKTAMWGDAGYGPWAIYLDDRFAGWGGFQPEAGEPDLGLVLHPDFWGEGAGIYRELLRRGFGELGFESVTILLPPGRKHERAVERMGFTSEGRYERGVGKVYERYRMRRPGVNSSPA